MNHAIKAGAILAVVVSLVSAIIVGSGLILGNILLWSLVFIVLAIGLTIGAVVWALRQSAAESGYGGQLLNALVLGLVGGVLITALSFAMNSFVFNDTYVAVIDASVDMIESSSMPAEIKDQQIAAVTGKTPMDDAIQGGIFTVITSLVGGAIAAIFLRRKG